jgi:hypothetical protein
LEALSKDFGFCGLKLHTFNVRSDKVNKQINFLFIGGGYIKFKLILFF